MLDSRLTRHTVYFRMATNRTTIQSTNVAGKICAGTSLIGHSARDDRGGGWRQSMKASLGHLKQGSIFVPRLEHPDNPQGL